MGPCWAKSLIWGCASGREGRLASVLADEETVRECAQSVAFALEAVEGLEGFTGEVCCGFPRFIQTEEGGVGGFECFDVFTCGLTELLGALGDIEDVVDDLECEAEA